LKVVLVPIEGHILLTRSDNIAVGCRQKAIQCLKGFKVLRLLLLFRGFRVKQVYQKMQSINQFICVLVHNCLHGTAPRYLQDVIQPVAATSRRRLRSTSSSALVVPVTRRTTIGDRAFSVAGPRAWNSLPQFVIDCSSPGTFQKYLKTYLFSLSF